MAHASAHVQRDLRALWRERRQTPQCRSLHRLRTRARRSDWSRIRSPDRSCLRCWCCERRQSVRMRCARGGPPVRRRDILACRELTSHGCVRIRRIGVVVRPRRARRLSDAVLIGAIRRAAGHRDLGMVVLPLVTSQASTETTFDSALAKLLVPRPAGRAGRPRLTIAR
jgi:hypothetical protein